MQSRRKGDPKKDGEGREVQVLISRRSGEVVVEASVLF